MTHPTDMIIRPIKDKSAYVVQFVSGHLTDTYVVAKIHEQLMELARKPNSPKLILDLSNVTMLSSEALGKLLSLHNAASDSGGSVMLGGVNDANVRTVFEVTRLDKVFKIYDSVEDAVSKL